MTLFRGAADEARDVKPGGTAKAGEGCGQEGGQGGGQGGRGDEEEDVVAGVPHPRPCFLSVALTSAA